jgi:hypothetical protein
VQYDKLEAMLKKYIPEKLQSVKAPASEELPVMLLWGTDPDRLREEKERLQGTYSCVCVVGSKAMEKYLSGHSPSGVIRVL